MKRKRKLIYLGILFIFIFISFYYFNKTDLNNSIFQEQDKYQVIKLDKNPSYKGLGQEKVNNTSGYFTTFTTSNNKVYKEYKQNDSLWAHFPYWGDTMANAGCGITALAIILSGYNHNESPEDLRNKYYPVLNNTLISYELSYTYKILNSDFYYDSPHLSKNNLMKHLKTNRPILICVWTKNGKNRWTTTSHYMVLLATDDDDLVYISNPNGLENTSKSSGWYHYDEIVPYIAKALYIESY